MKNGPYELVVAPTHYPGKKYRGRYAYEHHVKWWAKHGPIPKGYEIHHKNGDHRDNRLRNLQLLTRQEHTVIHAEMMRKPLVKLSCPSCTKDVLVAPRNYRFHTKNGRKNFFCSRQCSGKYNSRKSIAEACPTR